jgi:hypothetical protein
LWSFIFQRPQYWVPAVVRIFSLSMNHHIVKMSLNLPVMLVIAYRMWNANVINTIAIIYRLLQNPMCCWVLSNLHNYLQQIASFLPKRLTASIALLFSFFIFKISYILHTSS